MPQESDMNFQVVFLQCKNPINGSWSDTEKAQGAKRDRLNLLCTYVRNLYIYLLKKMTMII